MCVLTCVLSILCICGDLCVQSVLCVRVLVFHLGGVVFGGYVTGSQTCLIIIAWLCDGSCHHLPSQFVHLPVMDMPT